MQNIEYPNKSIFDSDELFNSSRNDLSPREEYDMAKKGFKIRINQGCLGACSYCMIKNATGKLYSEPLEDIVDQLEKGLSQGEQTVMLLGGDTGAYGIDIGMGFFTLLKELISIPRDYRLFIHDFNVNWLIKDLDEYTKVFELNEDYKKIRSINFPIQSGSGRILKLMRRPYKAVDATEALISIKENFSSIRIGTHVMVGFPSETEEDFELTLKLLEEVNFDFVTCFAYSEHKLADSARIINKVDQTTTEVRIEKVFNYLKDKVKIIK
jgi:tRNA A37 methylthiotransferase MiaB